jgi:hypothetical protein
MPDASSAPATDRPCTSTTISLSDEQQAALSALISGKAIREAAGAAHVHRTTISRWLHHDPHFRAAYNAWRQELIDSSRARLLRTAELATATVHRAIAKGDGRLALALLKSLGLASEASAGAGPSDPTLALDEMVIESDEHRAALTRRLTAITHGDVFAGHRNPSHLESLRQKAEKESDGPRTELA